MIFSSYIFIFVFFPTVFIGYYLLSLLDNRIYQRVYLIGASLFFYGYYNIRYLFLILSSIVVNYLIAMLIQRWRSKVVLWVGILFNILLLGYYKYYDFFVDNINHIFHTDFVLRQIALPLGISFFTFQQLSFLISVYKQEEKVGRLEDYCLFVSFFPQLIAGPIVLYSEMIPQFQDDLRRKFNADNFCAGLYVFAIGLFKKAVIADTVALFADNGFAMTDLSFCAGWITALSYTLQIYFDFSGYSDMAVGLGRMFNIELPFNFESPYQSKSIREFWRRWHITLGRALSAYIYIPLGGNRKGMARTCVNLMITFLVSGLWHGASWTFVLWGFVYGILQVIERLFQRGLNRIPDAIRTLGTFLMVNFLWVLFRADDFGNALDVYRGMFNIGDFGITQLATIVNDGVINFPTSIDILYVVGLVGLLLLIVFRCRNSCDRLKCFTYNWQTVISTTILFCVSLLCLSRQSVFIYYNF